MTEIFVDVNKLSPDERRRLLAVQDSVLEARRDEMLAMKRKFDTDREIAEKVAKREAEIRENNNRHRARMHELHELDQKESMRPSRYLYVDVEFDYERGAWLAKHDGVEATGSTPVIACDNFDLIWIQGHQ